MNGISVADLEEIMATTHLDGVYEKLLFHSVCTFPEKSRKALSMILAAVRPLTLDELCVAAEVDQDIGGATPHIPANPESSKATQLPRGWNVAGHCRATTLQELGEQLRRPFDNHIRQLCGHFVRFRCRRLYLVHQTARAYLTTNSFGLGSSPAPAAGLVPLPEEENGYPQRVWNPISMNEASTILLKVCVSYLTYFVPDPDEHMPGIWSQSRIETYLEQCRKDPPRAFFPYAALHWVNHYRPLRNALKSEYDWMLQPDRVDFQIWVKVHRSWIEEYFTVDAAPEAR